MESLIYRKIHALMQVHTHEKKLKSLFTADGLNNTSRSKSCDDSKNEMKTVLPKLLAYSNHYLAKNSLTKI